MAIDFDEATGTASGEGFSVTREQGIEAFPKFAARVTARMEAGEEDPGNEDLAKDVALSVGEVLDTDGLKLYEESEDFRTFCASGSKHMLLHMIETTLMSALRE